MFNADFFFPPLWLMKIKWLSDIICCMWDTLQHTYHSFLLTLLELGYCSTANLDCKYLIWKIWKRLLRHNNKSCAINTYIPYRIDYIALVRRFTDKKKRTHILQWCENCLLYRTENCTLLQFFNCNRRDSFHMFGKVWMEHSVMSNLCTVILVILGVLCVWHQR